MWYIVRTFVNATVNPPSSTTIKEKYKNENKWGWWRKEERTETWNAVNACSMACTAEKPAGHLPLLEHPNSGHCGVQRPRQPQSQGHSQLPDCYLLTLPLPLPALLWKISFGSVRSSPPVGLIKWKVSTETGSEEGRKVGGVSQTLRCGELIVLSMEEGKGDEGECKWDQGISLKRNTSWLCGCK
jgi:hypothetical protein